MSIRTTPAGLAAVLAGLGTQLVGAAEVAVVETTGQLGKTLSRGAKADPTADPTARDVTSAWTTAPVPMGAKVGTTDVHAVWEERGRAPGTRLPLGPIKDFVQRKGLWKTEFSAIKALRGRRRAAGSLSLGDEKDRVVTSIAFAIKTKMERDGVAPKWTLRKAIHGLGPALRSSFRRQMKAGSGGAP